MDNDLMDRRSRPPSGSNQPNSGPFIPPPTPAPWEPKPAPWHQTQTDAPLNLVPWDRPAADEPAPAASDDAWPQVDLTPSTPREAAAEAPTQSNTLAERAPSHPVEGPWDRPADAALSTDAQAGSASWDAPPPFVMDDEPSFVDDRPAEMFAAYEDAVAVAGQAQANPSEAADASPGLVTAPAAAEAPASVEAQSRDSSFDPYDADAPVVPEVARQALTPVWPSWHGHVGGGHEMAQASALPATFAAGQTSFEVSAATQGSVEIEPETSAPWATDWPDESGPVEAATARDEVQAQPWDWAHTADPVEAATEPDSGTDDQTWAQAHGAVAAVDPAFQAALESDAPEWHQPEPQWVAPADASAPSTDEVESPSRFAAESAAEPATTEVVATVPVDAASLANGPMTVIAGPEAGLPANLVLRIQLALVDDAVPAQLTYDDDSGDKGDTDDAGGTDNTAAAAAPAEAVGGATDAVDLDWPQPAAPETQPTADRAPVSDFAAEPSSEWSELFATDADFESLSDQPSTSPTTFQPGFAAPTADDQAVASLEAEAPPHVGSIDDDDQWWISPQPSVAIAPEGFDDQFEPVTPVNAGNDSESPGVTWPAAAVKTDDRSEWPQALHTTGLEPPVAAGSSDWGWPDTPPLGDAGASAEVSTDPFAPPLAWHSSVQPLNPAPLAPVGQPTRVGTMEANENDSWFLAAEPAPAADAAAPAATAPAAALGSGPRSSLMTAAWTVLMAVVVVILVLVFVQLMTSLLR